MENPGIYYLVSLALTTSIGLTLMLLFAGGRPDKGEKR